ncbi:TPA: EpsG family protein [Pseudomonas aeruginosa]|uniref:EpsG family protein n=1 Tax=Pseudomonas aeruginosa TaxID=287 RepID=UPI00044AAD53|nr:EpsG family protein [Pseudomonas aeruginosa]EIU2601702.1 EpsG family protein [Pseudomonas aeruginosa]EIU2882123.1 EpsG family protein [Pseudomonas aeruginosa]ELK4869058.1 EpsG family protein [Pseudomonas aeruginosa]ETV02458.1 hypothetical protein Q052_02752 [Pseudomonas aeruginosa BWHPSA047]MBH4521756.1 EpsG family protein [Pseudomonas aeruginosa]
MAYLFYCFLTLPFALFSVFLRRDFQFLLFLFFVATCVFVFGFSYKVGSDWYNYFSYFDSGCTGFEFDVGFEYLCSGFNWLDIGYWFFSFSIKAFYIVTLAWFLWRLGVFPLLAFFSCILVSFVFLDNMLRQQVAFGFILISVACVRDRKILAFVCLCLASSFHFSAVFFIPFYFLYISFSFRNLFAFVAVLSFFIGLSGNSIVDYLVNFLAGADGGYLGRALAYLEFDGYPVTLGHYFRFLILLMFVFLDLVIRGRQLSEQDSRIWRVISSGVILMLFYEMVFYEFSVFWMRIREYFLVFFMVSPLFLFRVFFWREARIFSALYVVYPLAVFWGVITGLPVYDDLYRDYRNYIFYLAVGDDGFDSIRDLAAQDYWDRWRRGELR